MKMKNRNEILNSRVLTSADEPVMPSIVAEAMKIDFGSPVTGFLCYAALQGCCAVALVFGDRLGRFNDGLGIRTSTILSRSLVNGYAVIETLNSRYVVCTWASDESGPRFPGVVH